MSIQPGRYRAQAVSIEFGISENGTDQAAILFSLLDSNETIGAYLYFSEKAAERSIATLRVMGWKGIDISTLTAEDVSAEVDVTIAEDEYQGVKRLKVQWINAPGSGPAMLKHVMDGAQKQSFAERMRGLAMQVQPVATAAPKPVAKPAAPATPKPAPNSEPEPPEDDMGDDGLPF